MQIVPYVALIEYIKAYLASNYDPLSASNMLSLWFFPMQKFSSIFAVNT